MPTDNRPNSPYVGLIPYTANDARFFFGRETETEIVCANLRSARLTLFYGASGVGKSSVLQAGVLHNLRELAAQDAKMYGQAEFAVVFYNSWARDPLVGLREAVHRAVAGALGIAPEMLEPVPETEDLSRLLKSWSERCGLELLIILDQFEELFNYLQGGADCWTVFAGQLAAAVNCPNLAARFLFSLRGDTLSLLDYFKEKIPRLFDNRLQLQHLRAAEAERAITEPIRVYNELYKPTPEYEIEPGLVSQVIDQVRSERIKNVADQTLMTAQNAMPAPGENEASKDCVETPYLQLVMKRIWREEEAVGSNRLRLSTLADKLGGATEIIQTHLDEVMSALTDEERRIASKCFKYLVTPMGTKVALNPAALAKYTEWDEDEIKDVLEILIKGKPGTGRGPLDVRLPVIEQRAPVVELPVNEARILKTVEIQVNRERLPGYEVAHDALIPAILDWRARYVIEHGAINQIKSLAKSLLPFVIPVAAIILGVYLWGLYENRSYYYVLKNQEELLNTNQQEFNANRAVIEQIDKDKAQLTSDNLQISAAENKLKNQTTAPVVTSEELIPILISLSGSPVERTKAIDELKDLIREHKVPKQYESAIIQMIAKIDKQRAEELRGLADAKSTPEKSNRLIYLQITARDQREAARGYAKILESNGFDVPGIEYVENVSLNNTQIRYFRKADGELAESILDLLRNAGFGGKINVQYIQGFEEPAGNGKPRPPEIWFAAGAFAPAVSQTAN
ncbi:MAG: hypothetical protein JSS81_10975 [Acidobacteria bacterium]|nr:hypothetical protein [Acidobacteriota bacterium]